MRAVLGGEAGPVRDIVLLNAAAALAADQGVPRPEDLYPVLSGALTRAAGAVDSGAAAGLLDRWIEISRRMAAALRPLSLPSRPPRSPGGSWNMHRPAAYGQSFGQYVCPEKSARSGVSLT